MNRYRDDCPGGAQADANVRVYARSVHTAANGAAVSMLQENGVDFLVAPPGVGFTGQAFSDATGTPRIKAPLTHKNAIARAKQ